MRKRPVILFVAALLFLYYPTEIGWRWWSGLSVVPADLLFSVLLPFLCLYGLIRVNRIGWYTLIAFGALWGIRDLYDYYTSQGANIMPLLMHLAIYAASLTYFINPRVRQLYFDPKTRWWRTKQRFETYQPVILKAGEHWHYPIIRNMSVGGCFIETSRQLNIGDRIELAIPLPIPLNVSVLKSQGEVRWISKNPLRFGMGVQFNRLEPKHAKALRTFLRKEL